MERLYEVEGQFIHDTGKTICGLRFECGTDGSKPAISKFGERDILALGAETGDLRAEFLQPFLSNLTVIRFETLAKLMPVSLEYGVIDFAPVGSEQILSNSKQVLPFSCGLLLAGPDTKSGNSPNALRG